VGARQFEDPWAALAEGAARSAFRWLSGSCALLVRQAIVSRSPTG
jgi:hypothetical protein